MNEIVVVSCRLVRGVLYLPACEVSLSSIVSPSQRRFP